MGHAVSLAVLDRLVGERLHRPAGVPAADRSSQRAAPAAELLDERRELEQVRARASHPRQRLERRPARRLVAETGRHREREQRRVVLRRPALLAHARRSRRPRARRPRGCSARRPARSRASASTRSRSSCRPRSRGSGTGAAAPNHRPPRRSRRREFGTCPVPGIGAHCGTRRVPWRFRYDISHLLSGVLVVGVGRGCGRGVQTGRSPPKRVGPPSPISLTSAQDGIPPSPALSLLRR